jgi:hypothetical protein
MNTTPAEETILKTDVLGRVKTPLARREQLLDEFEHSGLSGQKFAELAGIKYQTFATWAQKRRRARGAYPVKVPARRRDPVKWLEAVVEAAQPAGGKNPLVLVLELPGGAKAEISDARQVVLAAELLRALNSPNAQPPC